MENSSQPTKVSILEQLRQRRQSPGVINTESLHCHYQGIQSTTQRLLQKSALPAKIQFRYSAGGSHPVALVNRLYARRRMATDSLEQGNNPSFPDPYPTPSLIQSAQTPPYPQFQNSLQPIPTKTQSPNTTPKGLKVSPQNFTTTTTVTPQGKSQVNPPKPMQINHQKTLSLVNQKSSITPITLQAQPTTSPNHSPSSSVPHHQPSNSPLSDSHKTLNSFRVRRAVSLSDSNLSQPQKTEPHSIQPQNLPLTSIPTAPSAAETLQSRKISSSSLSPKSGQTSQKTNHQESLISSESAIKVQPSASWKAIPLKPQNLPLTSTSTAPNITVVSQTSHTIPVQSLPSTLSQTSTQSKPDHLQRLPLATRSSSAISGKDSPQATVSTPLTISTKQSQPQTTSPYQPSLELPLAITHIKTTKAIARQQTLNSSSADATRQPTTTQSRSLPENTTNPIDIAKLAQQVSRILGRQLKVEQERRGCRP